jgi:hypothetical protein
MLFVLAWLINPKHVSTYPIYHPMPTQWKLDLISITPGAEFEILNFRSDFKYPLY